jgi:hypothetical protein
VHRPDRSIATPCADRFDGNMDGDRHLVLPRTLTNRWGLSIDARIDMTLQARFDVVRWIFWRRLQMQPIFPRDDIMIDMAADMPAGHPAAASDSRAMPPAGRSSIRPAGRPPHARRADIDELRRRVASEMAAIQAAIDGPAIAAPLRRLQAQSPAQDVGADGTMPASAAASGGIGHDAPSTSVRPGPTGRLSAADRRRYEELLALHRTVRDRQPADSPVGTWPGDMDLPEFRTETRPVRSGRGGAG